MKIPSYFIKYGLTIPIIIGLLAGCGTSSALPESVDPSEEYVEISQYMTVENSNPALILTDNKDVLAADGLYYATWVIGDSTSYENEDGDLIDLYDAQLYVLLSETGSNEEAANDMSSWLAAEKSGYEILTEESADIGGQSYTLITYNCTNKDNPYDRGISAFTTFQGNAICAELTCRKDFDGDLNKILTEFLNRCQYNEN